MANITLGELIKELDYKQTYGIKHNEFNNIKIDSREIEEGDIFIALVGENHDAHKFIPEAFSNGAYLSITQKNVEYPHILVENTFEALKKLAGYMLKKSNAKSIAVTGSTGKTSTKDLICSILHLKKCHKTKSNENNFIGVSKTLLGIGENEVCVVEVGTNHIGEMAEIAKFFKPDTAVFTNIGNSHLEHFESRRNILKEKLSLLGEKTYPVYNYDDFLLRNELQGKGFSCSLINPQADMYIKNIKSNSLILRYLDKEIEIIPPKDVNIYNTLLSVAASLVYDKNLTQDEINEGLRSFKHQALRMQKEYLNNTEFILDCYNANPDSVQYAISELSKKPGKKMVILGDMLELGRYAKSLHRKVGEFLSSFDIDLLAFGKNAYEIYDKVKSTKNEALFFEDKKELVNELKNRFHFYDTILIKGSRAMKMEDIFYLLKGE